MIICRGLPASGKTTWSKRYVQETPNFVRVCRDDIRRMLGTYWVPEREPLVTDIEENCIRDAIANGYNIVIDATNFNPKGLQSFEYLAEVSSIPEIPVEVTIKDFTDVPLEECLRRDSERGEFSVGSDVVNRMYNKYLK